MIIDINYKFFHFKTWFQLIIDQIKWLLTLTLMRCPWMPKPMALLTANWLTVDTNLTLDLLTTTHKPLNTWINSALTTTKKNPEMTTWIRLLTRLGSTSNPIRWTSIRIWPWYRPLIRWVPWAVWVAPVWHQRYRWDLTTSLDQRQDPFTGMSPCTLHNSTLLFDINLLYSIIF